MRILIVGYRGMLGNDLVCAFKDHEVLGLDLPEMDITDPVQCRRRVEQIRPDVTICAAAMTAVDYCEHHAKEAFLVNGDGPGFLAAAAAATGSFFVHYSTDYIFDGLGKAPYVEEDDPNPLSIYGKSKLLGEQRVRDQGSGHLILRTSWLFGIHGKNFIRTIVGAARQGLPLKVVKDQTGSPTYSRDLASMTARLLREGASGTYHVTNGGACTWYELARHALDCAGLPDIGIAPAGSADYGRPAPRPANSVLANARLLREGFAPMRPWQDAVREYVSLL
jgi:dTDP-4-dehydrorhamnose reductase